MKLSDFPPHVQRRIQQQLADDLRGVPAAQPQPDRRRIAPQPNAAQAGSPIRVVVSLIALRRRALDDDNHVGACKHLRDAIAASLRLDDADKRLRWQYAQCETRGQEGVIVRIEILSLPNYSLIPPLTATDQAH